MIIINNTYNRHLYLILSLVLTFHINIEAQTPTIVTYPGPSTMTSSPDYTVTVGGKPVFVYDTKVGNLWNASLGYDYTDTVKVGMSYFDFDGGSVPVVIQFNNKTSISSVDFFPVKKGITPSISGNKISFNMNSHQRVFLRVDNTIKGSFMLFANPIQEKPNLSDPNLVYYGPGEHFVGNDGKGTISLNSNQTLFIDGGAVVHGYIEVPEKNNVKITGRGILDGSYIPHKNNSGQPFVSIKGSSNVEISGIILKNSPHWTIVPARSNNIVIDNVKIVNHRTNTDGIDPVNSQFVTIKNCFITVGDDCISPKGCVWNFTYPGSYLQNSFSKLTDLYVTNCLLWNNKAGYALSRIGDETVTDSVCRFIYEDNEMIASNSPFAINCYDRAQVSNILVENYRISENYKAYLMDMIINTNQYTTDATRGTISNIYFRNILSKRIAQPRCLGYDANHKVSNVTFEGMKAGSLYENKVTAIIVSSGNNSNVNFSDGGTTAGQVYNRFVKDISMNTAYIYWEPCPGYSNFELRIKPTGTNTWGATFTDANAIRGYQLTGLTPNTSYDWQIRTITTAGTHDWSLLQTFKTQKDPASGLISTGLISDIKVYPNPVTSNGQFTVYYPEIYKTNVQISDLTGRNILFMKMNEESDKMDIKISGAIQKGIYLLTLTLSGETANTKLIVN
jgi:hypothetical protein